MFLEEEHLFPQKKRIFFWELLLQVFSIIMEVEDFPLPEGNNFLLDDEGRYNFSWNKDVINCSRRGRSSFRK